MKDYWKGVASQMTAILIAAAAAALFTFFQSIAAQTGVCPSPEIDMAQAGTLGALFKGAHTAATSTLFRNLI